MRKRNPSAAPDPSADELMRELQRSQNALEEAYLRFNNTVEPELVDACVYEISAAQARCSYLLRIIKEQGARAAMRPLAGRSARWV